MVDSTCGRIVSVANRSEDDCTNMLASEIVALAENENRRLALSRGAVARSREFSWSKVVAALYTEINNRLQHMGDRAYLAATIRRPSRTRTITTLGRPSARHRIADTQAFPENERIPSPSSLYARIVGSENSLEKSAGIGRSRRP